MGVTEVPNYSGYGRDTDFSPDGGMMAVVGYDSSSVGFIKVIQTEDWTEISDAPTPPGRVFGVSFGTPPSV